MIVHYNLLSMLDMLCGDLQDLTCMIPTDNDEFLTQRLGIINERLFNMRITLSGSKKYSNFDL